MQKIYLGPTTRKFKNFPLKNKRVYLEEPAEMIAEISKSVKLFDRLFVDVENYLQAEEELKNPASPISLAYKQAD